jgi:hypothetical protein
LDHVFVTRAGVRVRSRQSDQNVGAIRFNDDEPIRLPVNGLDVKAADVAGGCWAVVSGQDDYPYLIKRGTARPIQLASVEHLKTHGRDAIWVTPDGDVSWLVKGGTIVRHMNGLEDPADFRHPLTPLGPPHIETWGDFRVTNVYRAGAWQTGEDVSAPLGQTRIYARRVDAPETVWLAFDGFTSRLAFHASHADGTCTLAVSLPGTFIHSSQFTLAASVPVPPPVPPPIPEPHPMPELPNRLNVVRSVDADYPHLLEKARSQGEQFRGDFVDQVAHRLNRADNTTRWGRKRKGDGSLNTDALTYLYDPSNRDKKALIDVLAGDHFDPTWDQRPASEEPGNGTWAPPSMPDLDLAGPVPPPPVPPPPTPDIVAAITRVFDDRLIKLEDALADDLIKMFQELQLVRVGLQALIDKPAPVPVVEFPDYSNRFIGTLRPNV